MDPWVSTSRRYCWGSGRRILTIFLLACTTSMRAVVRAQHMHDLVVFDPSMHAWPDQEVTASCCLCLYRMGDEMNTVLIRQCTVCIGVFNDHCTALIKL